MLFKKIPLWTQKGLAKLLAVIFYTQFYSKKEKLLNHEIHDNLVKTIFSLPFLAENVTSYYYSQRVTKHGNELACQK